MAKGPKRRIATKLEEVFGVPFAELIGRNFKKGDSRYKVQKRLLEMIVQNELTAKATKVFAKKEKNKTIKIAEDKWNPDNWEYDNFGAVSVDSNPAFRPSTLYHAIKDAINSGELDSFDFSTSNKGRKTDLTRRHPTVSVEFKCRVFGTRHRNNGITDSNNLNLRVYACPKCNTFGKCVAKVTQGGKDHYRAVIKHNGIRQEMGVVSEDNLKPIEKSPGHNCTEENSLELSGEKTKVQQ